MNEAETLTGALFNIPVFPFLYDAAAWPFVLMASRAIGNALEGKVNGGDQVLDVGTGTGMVAAYLAERFGANVTGVDASSAMLARAAMRVKDIRVGKVTLVQGNALRPSFDRSL